MHLNGCINEEGPSPRENLGEAATVWGQRMHFLGPMMVQEEVGQEAMMIIQVWSWASHPAQPSGSWGQRDTVSRACPAPSLVEFHLARSPLKCNFLFATEMILCQTKPQTSLGSKCVCVCFFLQSAFLLNLSIFFFSPSIFAMKKGLTSKNLKQTR